MKNNKHHNQTHGDCDSREYVAWMAMKARCYNPNHDNYKNYGGRGITICDRWLKSYEDFLSDMGRKPTLDYVIDRIDVKGDYKPNNCRWVTQEESNNNRSNNDLITFINKTQTLTQWAREIGIKRGTLWARIYSYKWPLDKALNVKTREWGKEGRYCDE